MRTRRTVLTETQTKQILQNAGFDIPEGIEIATRTHAVSFVREIGFPVVLKISDPSIAHKTDQGGVILNIGSEHALEEAVSALEARFPGTAMRLERQVQETGVDLILGIKRDEVFGPVVLLGIGGIYTEILADRSLHVGELTEIDAAAMIDRLAGTALLAGVRGTARMDRAALEKGLVALSRLACRHSEIVELDINPWRITRSGGMALDALAVVADDLNTTPVAVDGSGPEAAAAFFSPKSVAVVGASTKSQKAGNVIIDNMKNQGYRGSVFPVNVTGGDIAGLKSYRRLADCPIPVELAVLAVPYHQVMPVMADVARAGIRHAIVVSGGFSDAGPDGVEREERLLSFCRDNGIRLMGPNSIGTLSTASGFCTSIGTLPPVPASGISILGQSGTFSTGFALEEVTCRKRGFAKIACMGNKADIDECDFLSYLSIDPATRCIGVYLESVRDGERFMAAAAAAATAKPVVVLKSGRNETGASAAASHTGAMAGSDAVYDAVFHQTGLQRVDGLPDFFDILRAFDMCPIPGNNRIGIVSITGVGCVLAADACGRYGMMPADITAVTRQALKTLVPEWAPINNPADIWSTIEQRGPFDAYRQICATMIADPQVDILIVIAVLLDEGNFDAAQAIGPLKTAFPGKPILACHLGGRRGHLHDFRVGLESQGIPVYDNPDTAVKAAAFLYNRRKIASASVTRADNGARKQQHE